jgi:hypothetical protein
MTFTEALAAVEAQRRVRLPHWNDESDIRIGPSGCPELYLGGRWEPLTCISNEDQISKKWTLI